MAVINDGYGFCGRNLYRSILRSGSQILRWPSQIINKLTKTSPLIKCFSQSPSNRRLPQKIFLYLGKMWEMDGWNSPNRGEILIGYFTWNLNPIKFCLSYISQTCVMAVLKSKLTVFEIIFIYECKKQANKQTCIIIHA